ncbi:MAG: hypothetical protein ACK5LE_04770 [Alphaproteobacteria bacterium]
MVRPSECATPWKDMATELANAGNLSHNDFAALGMAKIVYLKLVGTPDAPYDFQIFSANGQMMYETKDIDLLLDWMLVQDVIPVALH